VKAMRVKAMHGTISLPGNVFHVPGALTVIVYLPMPSGRGIKMPLSGRVRGVPSELS